MTEANSHRSYVEVFFGQKLNSLSAEWKRQVKLLAASSWNMFAGMILSLMTMMMADESWLVVVNNQWKPAIQCNPWDMAWWCCWVPLDKPQKTYRQRNSCIHGPTLQGLLSCSRCCVRWFTRVWNRSFEICSVPGVVGSLFRHLSQLTNLSLWDFSSANLGVKDPCRVVWSQSILLNHPPPEAPAWAEDALRNAGATRAWWPRGLVNGDRFCG